MSQRGAPSALAGPSCCVQWEGGEGGVATTPPPDLNYIEMTGGKGRGLAEMRENHTMCVLGLGKMHSASKVRTF